MYGVKDTRELNPTHIHRFYKSLKQKKRVRKDAAGNQPHLSATFIHKTMVRVKAFINRLDERGLSGELRASDIPINKLPRKLPAFLTRQEIKQIMDYLEDFVQEVEIKPCRNIDKYAAYMRRALVRMLYTTGLRNFEIRAIKMEDIDLDNMNGTVLGKGSRYGMYTFNEQARDNVQAYL